MSKLSLYCLTLDGSNILIFYGGFSVNNKDVENYFPFCKVSFLPPNYQCLVLENVEIHNVIKILLKLS